MAEVTLQFLGELLQAIQAEQRAQRLRLDMLERRLERAVTHDDIRDLTLGLGAEIAKVQTQLSNFERSVNERFEKVDERFDKVDERFEKVDERFDKVDERFDKVDERFGKTDERFEKIEDRLERIEAKLDGTAV